MKAGMLRKHKRWLPKPWRNYVACHGDLRGCHYHPRWRDAIVCRLRGHDWYPVWDDMPDVMCRRCAIGPLDLAEVDA